MLFCPEIYHPASIEAPPTELNERGSGRRAEIFPQRASPAINVLVRTAAAADENVAARQGPSGADGTAPMVTGRTKWTMGEVRDRRRILQ
jgi:hypothetical protein